MKATRAIEKRMLAGYANGPGGGLDHEIPSHLSAIDLLDHRFEKFFRAIKSQNTHARLHRRDGNAGTIGQPDRGLRKEATSAPPTEGAAASQHKAERNQNSQSSWHVKNNLPIKGTRCQR